MKNWIICILSTLCWRKIMFNFIIGCILGFMVASVGFTGIAQALDKGLDSAKNISVKVDTGK